MSTIVTAPLPPRQYTEPLSSTTRSMPADAIESRATWMYAAAGSTASKETPVLRHAERGRGLVVADARSDEDDEIAAFDLLRVDCVVQRHRNACGAGVAPLLHHHVRLRD